MEGKRGVLSLLFLILLSLIFTGCTIDAPLEPRPILNLALAGDGKGFILVDRKEVKDNETLICQPEVKVTLEAKAAEDSVFSAWKEGQEKEEEKVIQVIMDQDRFLSAEFINNQ